APAGEDRRENPAEGQAVHHRSRFNPWCHCRGQFLPVSQSTTQQPRTGRSHLSPGPATRTASLDKSSEPLFFKDTNRPGSITARTNKHVAMPTHRPRAQDVRDRFEGHLDLGRLQHALGSLGITMLNEGSSDRTTPLSYHLLTPPGYSQRTPRQTPKS